MLNAMRKMSSLKMVLILCLVLVMFVSWSNALPTIPLSVKDKSLSTEEDHHQRLLVPVDYASEASQLVAINLLKSNNDIDGNQVHSSLGITTMLAILAEASDGRTYEEFVRILHYPEKRSALRESYKGILSKYQTRVYGMEPSFQTWLYVYRNFTIREDFRRLLRNYYYVDVKDINRDEYDWSEPNTSLELEGLNSSRPTEHDNSKDVIGFETLKLVSKSSDIDADISTTQFSTANGFTVDSYGEEFVEKETSKLDRIVDDKQYVEKPLIIAEIKQQQMLLQQQQQQEPQKPQEISNLSSLSKTPESSSAIVPDIEKEIEKERPEELTSNNNQAESGSEMFKPVSVTTATISLEHISKDASTTLSSLSTPVYSSAAPVAQHLNLEENETVQESEKLSKNPIKVNAPGTVLSSTPLSTVTLSSSMSDEDAMTIEETEQKQQSSTISSDMMPSPTTDMLAGDSVSSTTAQLFTHDQHKKTSLPLDKLINVLDEASKTSAESATMMSLESHVSTARSAFGDRSLFRRDDITSALSANSITGRDAGTKSKMLLFNGLYYRGNWATPFAEVIDNKHYFYVTNRDAIKTPMIYTKGRFHLARLPHLMARVLCLPYQNKRFNMMLVIPDDVEGLHEIIDKMQTSDFQLAKKMMEERDLHIVMPQYHIEETSRSETMLKAMGLTKLFSRRDADLSLLSDDHDLHVDEIVQFVNIRVDKGGSSEAGLSASNSLSRTTEKNAQGQEAKSTTKDEHDDANFELLAVDRPFLYFVMDCEREFILVSGKVFTPELPAEMIADIDIEFNRS